MGRELNSGFSDVTVNYHIQAQPQAGPISPWQPDTRKWERYARFLLDMGVNSCPAGCTRTTGHVYTGSGTVTAVVRRWSACHTNLPCGYWGIKLEELLGDLLATQPINTGLYASGVNSVSEYGRADSPGGLALIAPIEGKSSVQASIFMAGMRDTEGNRQQLKRGFPAVAGPPRLIAIL